MSDEAQTKPTIETVLERISALSTELRDFRMTMDMRLDRIESFAHQTHSDVLALRADFKEFKSQFKQPA